MRDTNGYCSISDYGFLSDCRSSALVAKDGSVDWLCWPRFDSPSVFARLLDHEQGGFFQIAPIDVNYKIERKYLEGTSILQTIFHTAQGSVMLEDWLHIGARQALVRLLTGLQGSVTMAARCTPCPDYARQQEQFQRQFGYLTMEIDNDNSIILEGYQSAWQDSEEINVDYFTIDANRQKSFTLGLNTPGPSNAVSARERAIDYWRDWSDNLRLPEKVAREEVKRSAMVLKGLQYQPTGAIIAAATTSLPEEIGGSRNYDYRFMWLRDSLFTLYALRSVGRSQEAESFFDFLKSLTLRDPDGHLQILYGVGGESELPESSLDHLQGYKQSQPVRIGNAAASQKQLDTLGEVADAIAIHHRRKSDSPLTSHRWMLVRELADRAANEWRDPDEGIWEVRGPAQHFVYSKVMCWVALDRAVRLARRAPQHLVDQEMLTHWEKNREEIKKEVFEKGYDDDLQSFTQYYGSQSLDAANLLLARVGFISAKDERFVNTVRATQRHLMRSGLVVRYLHEDIDDGFQGEEGTFTICTLWLVLALIEIDSLGEAEILFERVLGCASDLGLYSEELSSQGQQLGNFPQAFTHIALIIAAFALDRAYQQGERRAPKDYRQIDIDNFTPSDDPSTLSLPE